MRTEEIYGFIAYPITDGAYVIREDIVDVLLEREKMWQHGKNVYRKLVKPICTYVEMKVLICCSFI